MVLVGVTPHPMTTTHVRSAVASALLLSSFAFAANGPQLPGIDAAMQAAIAADEIAGAVTLVTTKDKIVHLEAHGLSDRARNLPMKTDTGFWIASMSKPITATAVLMLQDEGKLNVADPVAKYLPEFAQLRTPSGKPADLTLAQILTHTSGLGEAPADAVLQARTLADLIPHYLSEPMRFEPGTQWRYSQSGINTACRVVEVVSGISFDAFLQQRLFEPLGMKDTTFYPAGEFRARLATPYEKNATSGKLGEASARKDFGNRENPPMGNGGLYSTATDYAQFAQMLLNRGTLHGRRYLSDATFQLLSTSQTGDLATGFFQEKKWGGYATHYGWGIGTCVLRTPHSGAAEALSPGSFGHGGAWGTQAWIDPIKGVAYILMVQRTNHPNSDTSEFRRDFQNTAAAALKDQPL